MAARVADLAIIPCRPSAADLHAISGTIDLTRLAETRAAVVINAAPVNNPVIEQAREAIAGYHVEAVPAVIHQRIDHVHAFTAGLAATEWSAGSKAAAELAQLAEWIQHAEATKG